MENLNFLSPISLKRKIRLGPNKDGGYVLYEPALMNVDCLLTYGVGWDIDFEVDFYNLTGQKVLMYDPTMFGEKYVNTSICMNLLKQGRYLSLIKYLKHIYHWKMKLRNLEEYGIKFFNEGIANVTCHKYDTFYNQLHKNKIISNRILLKIDIEENEYLIFQNDNFMESLDLVDQMIVEFHNLKNRLRELEQIIHKLSKKYHIIHIHGNNALPGFVFYRNSCDIYFPDIIELTFLKKTSVLNEDVLFDILNYPDPKLDFPNVLRKDFERLIFD
ncbi:hypothetical protein [Parabacteroides goldsteinii]